MAQRWNEERRCEEQQSRDPPWDVSAANETALRGALWSERHESDPIFSISFHPFLPSCILYLFFFLVWIGVTKPFALRGEMQRT